jgi:hypothetical protein
MLPILLEGDIVECPDALMTAVITELTTATDARKRISQEFVQALLEQNYLLLVVDGSRK